LIAAARKASSCFGRDARLSGQTLADAVKNGDGSGRGEAGRLIHDTEYVIFAGVLLALIVFHLAAVAWHRFVRRDRVAARMIDGAPG
jgi:cytochrome b561